MSVFPVTAALRSNSGDRPAPETVKIEVGIFDANGYWTTLGNGPLTLPSEAHLPMGQKIASMLNAAYEQGRSEAQSNIRSALGIES